MEKKSAQDAIGLGFSRVIPFAAGEALAHFGVETRVQSANTTAGEIGQIAGMHDRFAVETGKEQAQQFDTGVIDGRPRRKRSGRIEVIDPAIRTVGVQQSLGRVFKGLVHRRKYR